MWVNQISYWNRDENGVWAVNGSHLGKQKGTDITSQKFVMKPCPNSTAEPQIPQSQLWRDNLSTELSDSIKLCGIHLLKTEHHIWAAAMILSERFQKTELLSGCEQMVIQEKWEEDSQSDPRVDCVWAVVGQTRERKRYAQSMQKMVWKEWGRRWLEQMDV